MELFANMIMLVHFIAIVLTFFGAVVVTDMEIKSEIKRDMKKWKVNKMKDNFYCKVCGADAEVIKTRKKFYVRCSECGDKIRTGYYLKEKEAVKSWNRGLLK